MRLFSIRLSCILAFALSRPSWSWPDLATGTCSPATWAPTWATDSPTRTSIIAWPVPTMIGKRSSPIQPGEINCRHWGMTYDEVDGTTCVKLARKYEITREHFFLLNPSLQKDCSNVQANVMYCVAGFIEPLRAFDGLCGPPHKNATCLGTDFQCCNAETFTCGNSEEDCAPGTCYEGACPGDKVWSTDGTCGYQHGNRQCAGKWGDCCNKEGRCGSGEDFCATGRCQSGKCAPGTFRRGWRAALFTYLTGNTTDGTCGGPEAYTCNVVYGNCCNKDGVCGSLESDCGDGCQPQFGLCNCSSSMSSAATSETSSSEAASTST